MRLFLVAAIVLIVFGIIASASSTGDLFSVNWATWFMASFLSYLVDLVAGFSLGAGGVTYNYRREPTAPR